MKLPPVTKTIPIPSERRDIVSPNEKPFPYSAALGGYTSASVALIWFDGEHCMSTNQTPKMIIKCFIFIIHHPIAVIYLNQI
jgi:hypothetical protein